MIDYSEKPSVSVKIIGSFDVIVKQLYAWNDNARIFSVVAVIALLEFK